MQIDYIIKVQQVEGASQEASPLIEAIKLSVLEDIPVLPTVIQQILGWLKGVLPASFEMTSTQYLASGFSV